jgi:glycopeptide antibiotics resistance protein
VSVLAETLQTSVASRVASWLDVLVNSVGTAVGAVLGATLYGPVVSAVRRLRTGCADRPFTTVASLLVFGLFFYRLAPFDFITDTDGLRASFLRAVWTIPEKCTAPSGAPPYAALIDQLVLAAWFAGLGYVLALSGREAERRRIPATASAIQQGCIIVVVTELMQLFTRSHVFDIATIVIGSLAVVFGAWFAIFVVDAHTRSVWKDRPDGRGTAFAAAVPTPVLLTLIVFQVGVLLASSIDPHVLSLGGINLSQVEWTPFEVLWRRPTLDAAGDVLSTLIIYGVLATTLVVALHRARIARVRLITAVAVTTLALVVEGLHTATMTHAADITGPMLALSASAGPLGGWLGSAFSQLPSAA